VQGWDRRPGRAGKGQDIHRAGASRGAAFVGTPRPRCRSTCWVEPAAAKPAGGRGGPAATSRGPRQSRTLWGAEGQGSVSATASAAATRVQAAGAGPRPGRTCGCSPIHFLLGSKRLLCWGAPVTMTSSSGGPSTREDFDFMERAGRGASSVVFKARRKADGKVYCVKEIDMSAVVPEEEEQALREVQLLASFEHPYVIRYFDSFLDDEILHIVMEWAEHGTLSDRLKAPGGECLSESQVWKWSLQIIVGLNHMHTRKVLHRDLKSANVFITAAGDAKIGDLGVSRALTTMQEMAHTVVGTPYYLSPELCEGRPYNVKSDVWALGCIMFEMCSGGSMPFQASNQGALILKILSGKQAALPQGRYSDDIDDLVSRCLTKAWQRRPDTTEILARQDVVKQARAQQIKLPESKQSSERGGRGGRDLREAAGMGRDTDFCLNRLHSAPAAPQSREGGQKPSYLGVQDDGIGGSEGGGSLGDTGSSSGTGGCSPDRDSFGSEVDGVEAGGAAAGRRKGRRRNIAVCQSLQELDLGAAGVGGSEEEVAWKIQGGAADSADSEFPAACGLQNNRARPVKDIDHLGRHPPRPPPEGGPSGNPRSNMLV